MAQISCAKIKPEKIWYNIAYLGVKFLYGINYKNKWQKIIFCHLPQTILDPFPHVVCVCFRDWNMRNALYAELDEYALFVAMQNLGVVEIYHI